MLGAVAGDIIGSPYTWSNTDDRYFEMCRSNRGYYRGRDVTYHPHYTDESVTTIAVARWLMADPGCDPRNLQRILLEYAGKFPECGFSPGFKQWAAHPKAYNSYGNAAAIRVSPIGLYVRDLPEAMRIARESASISHGHPDAIEGAEAMVQAVWMARHSRSKDDIRFAIEHDYKYDLNVPADDLRHILKGDKREPSIVNGEEVGTYWKETGYINSSSKDTVAAAIQIFLEGDGFEDTVRRAVAAGGLSDSIASMAGAIAEPFYGGVPEKIRGLCDDYLAHELRQEMDHFESVFLKKVAMTGKITAAPKVESDAFHVVKAEGRQAVYLVDPNRKDLMDALKARQGEDIRIESPRKVNEVMRELGAQPYPCGTFLERPRPEVRTLYFQDGEFRSPATFRGEGVASQQDRVKDYQVFLRLSDRVQGIKTSLQHSVGYDGEGSIRFASAWYPEIYHDKVELWHGDSLVAEAGIDQSSGRFYAKGDEAGIYKDSSVDQIVVAMEFYCLDSGRMEHQEAGDDIHFQVYEKKGTPLNIDVANNDVARTMDLELEKACRQQTESKGASVKMK